MRTFLPDLSRWIGISDYLSQHIDLEASARAHKALVRRRGVRSAADLLHLALLYGPGEMSLRSVASFACEAGIADVCDVSLLDRLRNCSEWLAYVLGELLAGKREQAEAAAPMRLSIIDGSTVSTPGAKTSSWRLHARYDPAFGCFTDLQITTAKQAEALDRVAVLDGDLVIHDRGYGRARNFVHALEQGANFISRIGWRSVKLVGADNAPFDRSRPFPKMARRSSSFLSPSFKRRATSLQGSLSGASRKRLRNASANGVKPRRARTARPTIHARSKPQAT
jgi:hypothetical protein